MKDNDILRKKVRAQKNKKVSFLFTNLLINHYRSPLQDDVIWYNDQTILRVQRFFFLLLKMELNPYLVILCFKFEEKIHFSSIFFNCKPLCFQHHISRELYVINKSYAYCKHDWAHYLANQLVYNYSIISNKSFDSEAQWLINEYQNNDKIIFLWLPTSYG